MNTIPQSFLRPAHHPGLAFIHSRWGQTPQNPVDGVIDLQSRRLMNTNNRLFVFSAYKEMAERVHQFNYIPADRPTAVVVTGSPGIGKSVWLEYMALRESEAGRPFLYFVGQRRFLVRADGVYNIKEAMDRDDLNFTSDPAFRHVLLLFDADIGPPPLDFPDYLPFIVQAGLVDTQSSPWYKQHITWTSFEMDPHPSEELAQALKLYVGVRKQHFTPKEIELAITRYAPDQRMIQKALEDSVFG
ncbi:hypothetical protein CYLTODRAFT_264394 [Cylindrobasidium torrendii FP15055 ss-10]|uniref:NACHT domain-containing protein n=1 Tax=Cylindrobasidium torrendii FP15055 ss-10 TaxID=1314674 RepID=A0A0D7BFD4_9AGAR|nr:hypothetical protein CYLTODRAFT_264394 [Cylindrobasidium torrendii FP15055 ss-10]